MKKETQVEGLMKTTFINEELDEKIGIKQELNVDSHLKTNKELYNQNDGYSPSKGFKRVASIPVLALQIWAEQETGQNNWFSLPKEIQKKILRKKLNSNEYKYFRTAEGRI